MPRSAVLTAILIASASPMTSQPPNTLSIAERRAGWRLLFDGKTTAGWHGYGKRPFPAGWEVIDGALTRVDRAGDIVTDGSYRDFELVVEWKVPPGGNSGIFYRGIESEDWRKTPIFHSAPEMQVLDDAGHADGKSPLTSAGSLYGLYPAPRGVVKPAGEWNLARVVVTGHQVEHWLNGTKVVEYQLGGADWASRVKGSKFADWPAYGTALEGVIGLQDHGDRVAFRNIKLRVIQP
ncbi:MAG: DUF1080 domain-containing protein [Gemmatimonadales bacterium]